MPTSASPFGSMPTSRRTCSKRLWTLWTRCSASKPLNKQTTANLSEGSCLFDDNWETVGELLSGADISRIATATHRLRVAPGEEQWSAAFAEGRHLSRDDALAAVPLEQMSARSPVHHQTRIERVEK